MTANRVIHALDTVFNQRPEPFDGLGVNVTSDVNLFAMPDASMMKPLTIIKAVVSGKVIREHKVLRHDVFLDESMQGVFLYIRSYESADAAFALHQPVSYTHLDVYKRQKLARS